MKQSRAKKKKREKNTFGYRMGAWAPRGGGKRLAVNRFPGRCWMCNLLVPEGEGLVERRSAGGWTTWHEHCLPAQERPSYLSNVPIEGTRGLPVDE